MVIGESMDRVRSFARAIGAEVYDPPYVADKAARLPHNRAWVQAKMNEGYGIIDIGADMTRPKYPQATSPYYAMERNEIASHGYGRYMEWEV